MLAFINEALLVISPDDILLNKVKEVYFKYCEILNVIDILLTKKDTYVEIMCNDIEITEKKNFISNVKEVKMINSLVYSLNTYIDENRIISKLKED